MKTRKLTPLELHNRRVSKRESLMKSGTRRSAVVNTDEIVQAMLDNGQRPFIANR